jgi:hypothetical protein
MSGPQKGEAGREACSRSDGESRRSLFGREASDYSEFNAGIEAPLQMRVAFLALRSPNRAAVTKEASLQNVHLPRVRLRCSIRVAYQAADALLPGRAEQARRQAKQNFAGRSDP